MVYSHTVPLKSLNWKELPSQMKRKLVSISALLLIAVALSFPAAPQAASATSIDCELTGQLCRQISSAPMKKHKTQLTA